MKVEFVDSQRKEHGVQRSCGVLEGTPAGIAPSTYYAAKTRPESARAAQDRVLAEKIERVHEDNYGIYGARKIWAELNRHGTDVARCTVERLMRETGLRGLLRDKSPRTTRPAAETGRPGDLVERDFTATGPNQLRVADLTYVRAAAGWVYVDSPLQLGQQTTRGLRRRLRRGHRPPLHRLPRPPPRAPTDRGVPRGHHRGMGRVRRATSTSAKSSSDPAGAPTAHPASTNTSASAARCCTSTPRCSPDSTNSKPICLTAAPTPKPRAGQVRSTAST